MKDVTVNKIDFLQLFEKDNVLTVPQYQRSYAWESNNLEELWEDLITVAFKDRKELFIGAVILCDDPGAVSESGPTMYEIVDGQQRLTSFTILLKALRDKVKGFDSKLAGDIYDFIRGGRYESKPYYKLVLGEEDREFFIENIQSEEGMRKKGKKKSHKLIRESYDFFCKKIDEEISRTDNIIAFVDSFFRGIKQRVVCAKIYVDSDIEAYLIFESINSKRADLTLSDLLKNYIYLTAKKNSDAEGKDLLSIVQANWQEMVENLNEVKPEFELPQYIRHYWISRHRNPIREKQLYREIKSTFKANSQGIVEFSNKLNEESVFYSRIISDQLDEDCVDEIDSLIVDINKLKIRQCYPLLLSCLAVGLPDRSLADLLRLILVISIRRSVNTKNPNEMETLYAEIACEMRESGLGSLGSIRKKLEEYLIKDEDIKLSFSQSNFPVNIAKFILEKFEESKSSGEKRIFRPTLEHVLPQQPENPKAWDMTREEHELYKGKIGNLTLVGKKFNQKMSNKVFDLKKSELLASDIHIARDIATRSVWGKAEIDSRGEELFSFFANKYSI